MKPYVICHMVASIAAASCRGRATSIVEGLTRESSQVL
jgi:hypothetical protein